MRGDHVDARRLCDPSEHQDLLADAEHPHRGLQASEHGEVSGLPPRHELGAHGDRRPRLVVGRVRPQWRAVGLAVLHELQAAPRRFPGRRPRRRPHVLGRVPSALRGERAVRGHRGARHIRHQHQLLSLQGRQVRPVRDDSDTLQPVDQAGARHPARVWHAVVLLHRHQLRPRGRGRPRHPGPGRVTRPRRPQGLRGEVQRHDRLRGDRVARHASDHGPELPPAQERESGRVQSRPRLQPQDHGALLARGCQSPPLGQETLGRCLWQGLPHARRQRGHQRRQLQSREGARAPGRVPGEVLGPEGVRGYRDEGHPGHNRDQLLASQEGQCRRLRPGRHAERLVQARDPRRGRGQVAVLLRHELLHEQGR
mmetsp:Transcript_111497/g.320311  ORF Transcript_111497/g.320311 Transcript_111497/m.320311 type:complete len:368 (-) Transcript_111497:2815-3918(-)